MRHAQKLRKGKNGTRYAIPYYLVKNSWGDYGPYKGTWYMSRDYMSLNTTYLFLNRHALPASLQEALTKSDFN